MTNQEFKLTILKANNLLGEDPEYRQLVTKPLLHTINDQLNCPVNTCGDLMQGRNFNIQQDFIKDGYDTLTLNREWTPEEIAKTIKTVYFTMLALDKIVSTGKQKNYEFKTKHHGSYYLEEVGIWDFKGIFSTLPLYLCMKNPENDSKVDLNIGLQVDTSCGWMNWPMKVMIVDQMTGRNVPCDFINCLGDINFKTLQRALNEVRP